jgi:hypothetical protein
MADYATLKKKIERLSEFCDGALQSAIDHKEALDKINWQGKELKETVIRIECYSSVAKKLHAILGEQEASNA